MSQSEAMRSRCDLFLTQFALSKKAIAHWQFSIDSCPFMLVYVQ